MFGAKMFLRKMLQFSKRIFSLVGVLCNEQSLINIVVAADQSAKFNFWFIDGHHYLRVS